ncbi:MAG TPA: superoxide dismutase family protein [Patescibacteria group bacterium]|nr:superoxide dismutase family protein [Patescibacteria group bacterium]
MKHSIPFTAFLLTLSLPAFAAEAPAQIEVKLADVQGGDAGTAKFRQGTAGLVVTIEAKGLTAGWHGVHFHAMGHCTHEDGFKAAGSHAAKDGQKHGFFAEGGPHDGDLPNLFVAGDGAGAAEFYTSRMNLDALMDADGSALMIHAKPDDYATDPSGDSGDRVACGVISEHK